MKYRLTISNFSVLVLIYLWTGVPAILLADSASLSIVPATHVYPIGEPFTIEVRVDTGGAIIGTTDATIAYDPENVSYVSVSGEGSVFSRISADSDSSYGKVSISGFIERGQEGFRGNNGLVAQLTFVPLHNVATQFHFASGSATPPIALGASVADLANILSGLHVANYTFIPKESVVAGVPFASAQETFEITPLPIPDTEWFGTTSVKLSWTLPSGATEMRTLVSEKKDATPTKVYPTLLNSATLFSIPEGKNYFLLQFKIKDSWGSVITYPLNVDVSPPSFVLIREAEREDAADPRVGFVIDSSDIFSGIGKYEVSIDGEATQIWERPENGIYNPTGLTPGEHILTVKAYDLVGNSTSTDLLFLVKSLESPILKNESVPERVLTGDTITIQGVSYPDAEVTVYISHNEDEATEKITSTDAEGNFTVIITDAAKAGKYTLWFTVTDKRGAKSPNSVKRSIEVTQPSIILFGTTAVTYLSILVPLIGLILLLVLTLWLGYSWLRGYRHRVQKETGDAYHVARDEFKKLRKELTNQIGMLEKANQSRELTREEMRIFDDLSKRLNKIERHITDEIEDIETVQCKEEPVLRMRTVEGSFETYRNKIKGESVGEGTHTVRL
ncbi:MAG: hypothetical protein UV60_C0009G0017 [Parcubacteria group bacterium GW2011_GWA2_43_11]|nr:MAG: hypothetical protein UU89_C0011G0012 [Parcubacteria group bacterium GW2011_GWC2_42_11]KKS85296.1 MAG: hypothetical protein UV60_C0009G0017 [Parcubacteria group bacterium GW2011_GWA2_43_11]